mmetsp:Transcript_61045/g.115332  ORF Transcript_61045/g.115332 Transcript_61045/m.115332 type:complete len:241 (-) Transcript_61045:7-729(-)
MAQNRRWHCRCCMAFLVRVGMKSLFVFPERRNQLLELFFGHEASALALLDPALLWLYLWSLFLIVFYVVQDFEQLLLGDKAGAFASFYSCASGGQRFFLLLLLLFSEGSSGVGCLNHIFGDEASRLSVSHLLLRLCIFFDFNFFVIVWNQEDCFNEIHVDLGMLATASQRRNKFLVSEAFLQPPVCCFPFIELKILTLVFPFCLAACAAHGLGSAVQLSTELRASAGQHHLGRLLPLSLS